MPRKKINRKNQKKRNYRKKRRNAPLITRVRGNGFSDSIMVKLKYAEEIRMNGSGLAYNVYSFRGNSLYDPNYTGTGHQPMYFDQYANIYARYRVMGAKITLRATNVSTTQSSYLVLQAGSTNYIGTEITELLEQPRAGISRILPYQQRFPSTIKMYCSTQKATGYNRVQAQDDDLASVVTDSPAQVWYFNILAESVDGSTAVDTRVMVCITYYAQFYDRVLAAQS